MSTTRGRGLFAKFQLLKGSYCCGLLLCGFYLWMSLILTPSRSTSTWGVSCAHSTRTTAFSTSLSAAGMAMTGTNMITNQRNVTLFDHMIGCQGNGYSTSSLNAEQWCISSKLSVIDKVSLFSLPPPVWWWLAHTTTSSVCLTEAKGGI